MSNYESQGGPSVRQRVTWKSPSNIAIVKYWGKHGEQLPANPSLSLTLSEAYTVTSIDYVPGTGNVRFLFEGQEKPGFTERVVRYVDRLRLDMPALGELDMTINSENSFPHSAGIASSASAMSALALCLYSIAHGDGVIANTKASHYARLGSGSACRSVEGPVVAWGQVDGVDGSSDLYGVSVGGIDPVFESFRDSILIVDRSEKQVKSSAGHALMHTNPYAQQRFDRANLQLGSLLGAMRKGDIETFGEIAEAEALDLHAMMMTSTPSYMLMRPGTVEIIERIRAYRAEQGVPVYFTLDAGPNVHVLYPHSVDLEVKRFIEEELKPYCTDGMIIHDKVGHGAIRVY